MIKSAIERRAEAIKAADNTTFEVVIIGGGVHGAAVARETALRGYRTLLLERRDYGSGTSSRSSKMLHGGIRYLEGGEISLVREALRERSVLLRAAPHLTRPQPFLFPVIPGQTRPAWQIGIGLTLYDLLASLSGRDRFFPWHRKLTSSDHGTQFLDALGLKYRGAFEYYDGQMDDARLVIEQIVDAKNLGALTFNYAPVTRVSKVGEGWELEWKDALTETQCRCRAKYLVNATGPWIAELQKLGAPASPKRGVFRYSRGTHLLFDLPWNGPGVILPTPTAGRYYFVWPYFSSIFSGTLVGTTECEIEHNEADPKPSVDEVEELLALLAKDLPESGLTKDKLCGEFAGVRLLFDKRGNSSSATSDVARTAELERDEQYVAFCGPSCRYNPDHRISLSLTMTNDEQVRQQTSTEQYEANLTL